MYSSSSNNMRHTFLHVRHWPIHASSYPQHAPFFFENTHAAVWIPQLNDVPSWLWNIAYLLSEVNKHEIACLDLEQNSFFVVMFQTSTRHNSGRRLIHRYLFGRLGNICLHFSCITCTIYFTDFPIIAHSRFGFRAANESPLLFLEVASLFSWLLSTIHLLSCVFQT